ncbi:MAG: ribonucleotide reductase, partial [bacterium]
MDAARKGDVWIVKKQYDANGERIYSNVCQEILLKSRDTCLLSHINLGLTTIKEIPTAFADGMR